MSLLADIKQYKNKSWASTRKPSLAFRDIGWAVGLAGTCLGFICFGMSSGDASAASITVSITDSSADLNLVATEGGVAYGESDTASFSVSTTSSGGYTATITGGNSTGRLTGTDSNNYFTSISSAIASPSNFNNGTWGFKPSSYNSASNTSYQPVATSSDTATLDVTNSAMTGNYTLAVAAKTDTGTAADTYSYNFIVAATTNAIDYDIAFVNPADGMPARMTDSTTGSSVTLPTTTPTMSGYVFAGWCTTSVSAGSACTGTTYQPGASFPLSSGSTNDVTLYALWQEAVTFDKAFANAGKSKYNNYYQMHEMTTDICSAVTEGETGTLIDRRDSTTYTVGKLADGKCWMLDNLALGGTSTIAINSTYSNVASNFTLPASTAGGSWGNSTETAYINVDSRTVVPSDAISQAGGYKVGVYYSIFAATAGTFSMSSDSWATTSDICPKGWRLPVGGYDWDDYSEIGDFSTLTKAIYGSVYTDDPTAYANYRSALHLPLSGSFINGTASDQGSNALWHMVTTDGSRHLYRLRIDTTSIIPVFEDTFTNRGSSIRCLAK